MKSLISAATMTLFLLVPELCLAGFTQVFTVSDSSASSAVNFDPSLSPDSGGVSGGIGDGGTAVITIAPGVAALVTTIDAAISSGNLGLDQVAAGVGAGGAAITLSEQAVDKLKAAATQSIQVEGEATTPLDALLSLSTSPALGELKVMAPKGKEVTISAVVTNLTSALTSDNPTLLGTALNDAAVIVSMALKANPDSPELKSVGELVAELLDAVRHG